MAGFFFRSAYPSAVYHVISRTPQAMNQDDLAALERERRLFSMLEKLDGRMEKMDSRIVDMSARLMSLEARMEDLEDRDRYARNAARYSNPGPRIFEASQIGSGSVNASKLDSVIFPSLAG